MSETKSNVIFRKQAKTCEALDISRYTLNKIAKECGAIIRLSDKHFLYDVEKIANYMRDTMGLAPVVPGSDQDTTAETAPKADN